MNRHTSLLTALFAAYLLILPSSGSAQSLPPIDDPALAELLLNKLDVGGGEKVLLVGKPGRFDPLIDQLQQGLRNRGANFLGTWSVEGPVPASWSTSFTDQITNSTDGELLQMLSDLDASIMLPGANPSHRVYAAIQGVLRGGRGRTIHFHWEGAYGLDGMLLPGSSNIDALYRDAVLNTDYVTLASEQLRFEQAMRGAEVRVTTPAGTDITFEIQNRPVNRQDGDASAARTNAGVILIDREIELPAGAIRVAPIESTVNGTIVFPPSDWGGTRVEGLTFAFTAGYATQITATTGLGAAMAIIDQAGTAGRSFREFALGFNPLLAIPESGQPWIPYYGYGAGVVRLSLGDNSELGGNVTGGFVRWNFFTDATVTVGGEVWVSDGRLVTSGIAVPSPPTDIMIQ